MADKDIFEQLHPDFVNSFREYLSSNGINPDAPAEDMEELKHRVSITNAFVSKCMRIVKEIPMGYDNIEEKGAFFKMYNRIWGRCLQLSTIYLYILEDLCKLMTVIFDEEHIKGYVLAKIMGKGIRTYAEVLTLQKNGFPYGAAALTRNLFELMVIMRFIEKRDKAIAKAYFEAAEEPLEQQRSDGDYIWAKAADCFKDKKKITFSDIRKESGLDDPKLIYVYKFLCKFIHADPLTVNYEMGMDTNDIIIGGSLMGIDVSGVDAALFTRAMIIDLVEYMKVPEVNIKSLFCAEWCTCLCKEFNKAAIKSKDVVVNTQKRTIEMQH